MSDLTVRLQAIVDRLHLELEGQSEFATDEVEAALQSFYSVEAVACLGHTVWLPTKESHSVLPSLWIAILTPPTLRNWYARSQLGLLHFGHTRGRSVLWRSWGTHSCPHRHLYAVT